MDNRQQIIDAIRRWAQTSDATDYVTEFGQGYKKAMRDAKKQIIEIIGD